MPEMYMVTDLMMRGLTDAVVIGYTMLPSTVKSALCSFSASARSCAGLVPATQRRRTTAARLSLVPYTAGPRRARSALA